MWQIYRHLLPYPGVTPGRQAVHLWRERERRASFDMSLCHLYKRLITASCGEAAGNSREANLVI